MPYRRLPNTTPAVLRTLKTAYDTYRNTPVVADRAISVELFTQLDLVDPDSLHSRLAREVGEVDLAQAAQGPLTIDLEQKADRLALYVSHFHQVLDLGIARGTFAAGARSYYGRDLGASTLPDLSSYAAIAEAARKIPTGEIERENAEGANYIAMALPSAGEIEAQLALFDNAFAASQAALVKTDREREDVSTLYPAAQALAVDVVETVEFFYRKDPVASSRRAKAIRWGVVYIYEEGETPDEPPLDPPPTPPAPPTPPTP